MAVAVTVHVWVFAPLTNVSVVPAGMVAGSAVTGRLVIGEPVASEELRVAAPLVPVLTSSRHLRTRVDGPSGTSTGSGIGVHSFGVVVAHSGVRGCCGWDRGSRRLGRGHGHVGGCRFVTDKAAGSDESRQFVRDVENVALCVTEGGHGASWA
jgi:hypothetical protein